MTPPRLHRLLLRLHPPSFRRRHGRELLELCRTEVRRARERGRIRAVGAWLRTLADLIVTLPGSWWDALPFHGRSAPSSPTRETRPMLESIRPDALLLDLRLALRRLGRSPGFTAAAVLTLGVGLGAATAVYSVVDQVLLRPLPYPNGDRLVALWEEEDGQEVSVNWQNFSDWESRQRSFEALALYGRANVILTGEGPPERLRGLGVTTDLFRVTGVEPRLGRFFEPGAARRTAPAEVVLGHHVWRDRFGAEEGVLGRTIRLDAEPYTVVGVAPEGFRFPHGIVLGASDLFIPLGRSRGAADFQGREGHPGFYALGLLAEEGGLEAARRDLSRISAALEREHPASHDSYRIRSAPAREAVVGDVGPTLILLALAVGMVLLVAAANVSGLFLARSWAREAESAVQVALGAGRGRLTHQILVESLLVGLGAGAVAVPAAALGLRAVAPVLDDLPRAVSLVPGPGTLAFAAVAAVLTALLVGLLPAVRTPRIGRVTGGSRGGSPGLRQGRLRSGLVAAEVALSVVLLVSAVLLLRSFERVRERDGGIEPEGVLVFDLGLPDAEYADDESVARFYRVLRDELEAIPGVRRAGSISTLPFSGFGAQAGVGLVGAPPADERSVDVAVVQPGYFETMGVELVRGRLFDADDRADSEPVAVVDERFARTFFGNGDPLGRTIAGWGAHQRTVVGVVRHVKNYGVLRESREELYVPHAQRPYTRMTVTVATTGDDPLSLVPVVRRRVAELDPRLPVTRPRSMEAVVAGTLDALRTAAVLGSLMAALGGMLSVVGVYALVAYAVARRTHEIGVRMALGARERGVRRMVVLGSLKTAGLGVAVGLVAALLATRGLDAWIHGISPGDPLSFVGSAAALLAIIAGASWIPARRAARIDPIRALRAE